MSLFSDLYEYRGNLPYPVYNEYEDRSRMLERMLERRLYETTEYIAEAKVREYMERNFVFVDVSKN